MMKKLSVFVVMVSLLCGTAFAADTEAPTINVNRENGSTLEGGSRIVVEMTDENMITEIVYNWDDNAEKTREPNTNSVTLNLGLGTEARAYELHIKAIDSEGNTADETYTFYVVAEEETEIEEEVKEETNTESEEKEEKPELEENDKEDNKPERKPGKDKEKKQKKDKKDKCEKNNDKELVECPHLNGVKMHKKDHGFCGDKKLHTQSRGNCDRHETKGGSMMGKCNKR